METKICTLCNTEKELSAFKYNKDTRYKSGGYWHSSCRDCEGKKDVHNHKFRYKDHPELYKDPHVTLEWLRKRDGDICPLCGVTMLFEGINKRKHPQGAQLDHIVPVIEGGEHSESNCRLLCKTCNDRDNGKIYGRGRPSK